MGRVKSKFSWAKAIILFLSFLLIASTLGVSLSLFRDNTTDEQSNNFAPIVLSDDSFNTLKSQVTVDMLGKSILVQPVSFVVSKDTSSSIYVRACVKFDGVANDARQKLAYESLTAATPVAGKSYKWTRFGQYYYLCDGSNQLVSLSSTNSGEVFNLLEKETNIVPEDIIDEKFAGGEKVSLSVTLQSVQTSKVSSSNIERAHSSFNAVEPTLANTKTQCSIYFYDANGLSLGSQTVAYGKGVNIPTPASQSGKQHIGWNTKSDYTGATLDEEDLSSVYEDLVLYAEFDALTYNVTVIQPTDESGNQIGTITPGSTTIRYGQSLTFRVIPNSNYYIYGVYIENDETHQKKNIGSLTEFVVNGYTSDITIWADISQEVIFLDINGGTGTQPRITFNEDKTKFVLSEIEPVGPNGKEFYYYSTNPLDNEEGQNGIRIDLGVEYPLSYLEGNKVLYAIYLTPTENYQTATNYIVVPKNVASIQGVGENNMFGIDTPDVKFVTLSRNVKKIGNSAFKNLDGLTGLSMSTVVDSIGNNAFENCVSLEQFVFGPFVNKIGDGAFKNCVSLSTLKNLENIPTTEFVGTFEGCTMLINVTLPSVATKIEGTFKNCSNLIEVVLPNGLRNIGESTFENCVSISVIEIPSTISFLGEKAFRNCVALTEIAGLENIVAVEVPDFMFENCVSLKEINIPSNTAIIGRRAFGSCSALEKITNLSIVKVGEVCEEAFLNCSSLGELIFNGSLNIVGSQAFAGSGVSKVSLSQRLSSLGESAFENCVNLSTVQNLGIISVIAQNTFKNCSNLFSITIPATVTTIETLAFENCSSLSSLNVPASVQTIGVDALKNATGLKSITLQGDLTTIYNLASTKQNWYYNTMMVEALNTKGYYTTFVSDWIVTNINGNNYITGYRGEDVNVTIPYIITDERGEQTYIYGVALNTYDKISGFENVVLEEGIQSIFILEGKNITTEEQLSYPCFKDCKTLKSISLPSTLSQISDGAFAGCENLTQIIGLENTKITKMGELFPARHTSIWEYDEIVQINNQDIKIAYDYKEILGEGGKNYRGTFESTALKEIKLPATLQIIGPLCFSNILTISTIHIPASVRAIGAGAFINLPALQSITGLENCVLDYKATVDGKVFECGFAAARYHVGDGASYQNFPIFWGLSIKTLTLPSFATFFASDFSGISVGSLIAGCLPLEEITLLGDWPQEFSLATINESEFGINSYQWYLDGRKMTTAREAGTYTIFPSSETSDWVVDENGMIIAYKGSNTTVTVPASVVQNGEVVTVVGVKSFRNPILTNITVSEGITKIDAGAFANMTKLKRVKLAKSILEIGNKAFENCSSLVSVVLPENTKTVGSDIFIGCSSIKIIVLNNDITTEQNLTNISDGDWFYQNGSSSVSTSLMKSKGIYSKYSNVATTAEWEVKSYQTKNYITAYLGTSRDITVPAVVVESDYSEAYEIYGLAALKKYNFTSIIISEGIETIGLNITDVEQLQQTLVSLGLMNTDTGIMEFPFMRMGDGSDLKFNDSLTTFVLPDSLDVVGIYGFAGVKLKGLNTLIELKNISVLGLAAFGLAEVDEIQVNMQATKTLLRIEQQAFVESTAKIISIGYGPTLIGEGAFNSCANLIELNLPTSVVTIEDGAFNGCSSLVELNLRDARQIGSISGCSSLEKIILGASLYSPYAVSNISGKNGSTWFYEGGSDTAVSYFDLAGTYLAEKPDLSTVWTYEQINGKWYITGYTGNSVNLTVPSSLVINGTETQIAGIKSINTNEGVDIETLVISEGIAEILENALSGKTKLSSITLPQTLTSIGANAFSGTIISLLTLSSENLTLNAGALDGMSELTIINVQNAINTEYTLPTNATWTYISYDSDNNQSSSSSTTTLLNKGIYTTLANVATTNEWIVGNENNSYFIAGYKLDYTDSTKILEIPRLVINHKTFEVYEISSIKSLYMQSLSNYSVEISLKVSEGITKIDTKSYSYSFNDVTGEYFSINQSLKGNGNNIVSIELPATLLELGDYAFANLNHLKEIKNLENTQIKELKQNAFYNNYDLTQLVFPITLQEIYSGNFSSCSALKKIILNSTLASSFDLLNVGNGIWYYNSETTRTITMQKAGIYSSSPIQNIGLWVVELIGEKNYITAYLGGATELVVPYELFNEDTGEIVQIFGVRGIGKTDLESITFEEGIEEIGENTATLNIFGDECPYLKKILMPSTLTTIYEHALDGISAENIVITIFGSQKNAYTLSAIKNTTWYYGKDEVATMQKHGSYMTFKVEAYMPDETTMGKLVSENAAKRNEIVKEAGYGDIDNAWYVIDNETDGKTWYMYGYLGSKSEIVVPHYVMDYFTIANVPIMREISCFWGLVKDALTQEITKITLEEGYTTFGAGEAEEEINAPAMTGSMGTVKDVVLPSTLTKLGVAAFVGFTSLENINLEVTKLTSISMYAFAETLNLKKVKLPATLKKLEMLAFYGSGLAELELNEGLISLDAGALSGLANLKVLTISSTISSIQQNVLLFTDVGDTITLSSLEKIVIKKDLTTALAIETITKNIYYKNGSQIALSTISEAGTYLSYLCGTTDEWNYETIDGKNYITGYVGKKVVVDVPTYIWDRATGGTIEIYGVKSLNNSKIRKLTIREGIKAVGNGTNNIINGTYNNTLTYVSIASSVVENDAHILDDCFALESINLFGNLQNALVTATIKPVTWHSHNDYWNSMITSEGQSTADEVTKIASAGGYSTYSIGQNIVQAKPAQGGFGGDLWMGETGTNVDAFVPAFGIFMPERITSSIITTVSQEQMAQIVPMNSVISLRGFTGTKSEGWYTVAQYNATINFNSITFAEGITRIGDKGNKNNGVGAMNSLYALGPVVNKVNKVGSEDKINLISFDGSFESSVPSAIAKDGGTLSLSNSAYAGSKALSYSKSGASKATITTQLEAGVYVFEAMVKSSNAGAPLQVQLSSSGSNYSIYYSDVHKGDGNYQYVFVKFEVQSSMAANLNLIQSAIYDCMSLYRIDRGLPTTLTVLGANAFSMGYSNESSFVTGLTSINLSQTAIEELELFALGYTFTNYMYYEYEIVDGKHVVYNYEIPFYTSYVNKGSGNGYEITYTMTFPTSIEKFVTTNENDVVLTSANGYIWNINDDTITKPDGTVINIVGESENAIYISDVTVEVDWNFDVWTNTLTYAGESITMVESSEGLFWGDGYIYNAKTNRLITPHGVENGRYFTQNNMLRKDLVVAIPKTLTTIGYMALNTGATKYYGLEKSSLKSLEVSAFGGDIMVPLSQEIIDSTPYGKNLIELNLPASFEEITKTSSSDIALGPIIMFGLAGIGEDGQNLTYPTNFEGYAFVLNSGLQNINIAQGNTTFSSKDGVLFNANQTKLIAFPSGRNGNYSIPETVTTVGEASFMASQLSKVIFPANLTTIEDYAFCGTTVPASVVAGGDYEPMQESILKEFVGLEDTKVETIGRGAFACLTRLNTLLLPKTLKTMGASGDAALSPIAKAGLGVIVLNSSISNPVTLGYNMEDSDDIWLYNLSSEVYEMQPKGVYSKGQFELSWKVEKIDEKWWIVGYLGTSSNLIVPNTVVNDDGEIVQVHGIKSLNYQDATQITVSDGIKEIGYPTDSNNILGSTSNSKLNAIVLMGDVQNMTENSLLGMKELSYITLSNDLPTANSFAPTGKTTWYHYSNGTSEIVSAYQKAGIYTAGELQKENQEWVVDSEGYIIAYKGSKTELVVPSHLLKENSDEVIIVKGIKSFKNNTYGSATTLAAVTSVTISNGIKTIEDSTDGAFRYLSNVVEINIPSTMTYIGHNAFLPCTALETITIPNGVETIQVSALPMDKSLSTIILEGNLKNNFVIPSSYGTWFYNSEQTPIDELSIAGTYKKATYSIKYDGKGATLSSGETSYIKSNFLQGKSITLDENQFTNQSNANFLGWTTKPRSVHVEYPAGGQFKLENTTHVPTSDYTITLYAVWEQNIKILTLDPNWNNSADDQRGYTATKFGQSTNISQQIDLDFTTEIVISGSFATTANTNSSILTHLQSDSSNIKLAIIQNKLEVQVNNAKILSTNTLATDSGYSYFIHKTGSTIRLKVLAADGTTFFDNSQAISQLSGTTLTFGIGYANNDNGIIYGSTMLFESAMLKLAYLPDATNANSMLKINEDGSKTVSALNEATSVATTTLAVYKMIPTALRSTLPPEVLPSRFGYQIDGYYYNQAGSSASIYYTIGNSSILEGIDAYPYDADVVAEAYWIAKPITIKWNANGGTGSANNMTVYFDQGFKTRGVNDGISRVGYTLTGWRAEGWRDFDAQITEYQFNYIKSDWSRSATSYEITFYAIWTPNQYTVTFNPNGGSVSPTTKTVTYDSAYGALPTPTRTGYTQTGWTDYVNVAPPLSEWTLSGGAIYDPTTDTISFPNANSKAETPLMYVGDKGIMNTGYYSYVDVWCEQKTGQGMAYCSASYYAADGTYYNGNGWAGGTVVGAWDRVKSLRASKNGTQLASGTCAYIKFTFSRNSTWAPNPFKIRNFDLRIATPGVNEQSVYRPHYVTSETIVTTASNHTLHAEWTANTYHVTYHPNGGNGSVYTHDIVYGETFVLLDPTDSKLNYSRDDHVFSYWSMNQDGSETSWKNWIGREWSWGYDHDVTFYAQWNRKYHIIYHANGGSGATMSETIVASGQHCVISQNTYTKTGYTFSHWAELYPDGTYRNNYWTGWSGTWQYANGQYSISDYKLNLYAIWTPNQYTVTFNPNGGSVSPTTATVTYDSTYGTLPTPTKTGYNFAGWWTAASGGTQITSSTKVTTASNHSIYAHWTPNQYTVTFNPNGGTVSPTTKTVTYDSTYGTLPTPTRTGYTFAGWWTATSNGTQITSSTKVAITAAQTLYAHWTPITYTMTLDYNNQINSTLTTKSITYGNTYGSFASPTKTGYTLNGWRVGRRLIDETTFNGSSTYINLGRTYMYTDKITVMARAYMNDWTQYKNGMRIISCTEGGGWNLEPGGEYLQFAIYDSGVGYKAAKSNISFANLGSGWHTFMATFDGNYARLYIDGRLVGTSAKFSSGKIGYNASNSILVGAEVGSSNTAVGSYFNGKISYVSIINSVSNTATSTAYPAYNTVAVACWTANTYTVTFNPNGGSVSPTTKTVTYDSTYGSLPTPTRTGYTFAGWWTATSNGTQITSSTKVAITAAQTLYAHWTANTYTVTFDPNNGNFLSRSSLTMSASSADNWNYSGNMASGKISQNTTYTLKFGTATCTAGGATQFSVLIYDFTAGARRAQTTVSFGSNVTATLTTNGELIEANDNRLIIYAGVAGATAGVSASYQNITLSVSKSVTYDSTYGSLPALGRAGYTFAGWWTAASNGTQITSSTKVTTASNHTIYAHWTPNTYTVTFDPNGRGGRMSEVSSDATYSGNNLTINYYTSSHKYKLTNSSSSDPYATIGATVYLTANTTYLMHMKIYDSSDSAKLSSGSVQVFYAINSAYNETNSRRFNYSTEYQTFTVSTTGTYNIRLDNDCGQTAYIREFWIMENFQYQATVTYDSTYGSLPALGRAGYTFAGWWTAASNGTQITSSTKVAITAAQTLYAKWNINSYTLSIDPNGGYRVSDNSTAVITVTKNYQASENISERRKTGYTLTGYTLKNTASGSTTDIGGATFTFNNSTKIGVFTQGTVACTLVAQWTPNTIKITLNKNGGTGGTTTIYYKYGINTFYSNAACTTTISKVTFPTQEYYNCTGYVGDGTSGGNNGEVFIRDDGTFYGDLCTDIYKDATLTARWSVKTYTLTVNWGSDSNGNGYWDFNVQFNGAVRVSSSQNGTQSGTRTFTIEATSSLSVSFYIKSPAGLIYHKTGNVSISGNCTNNGFGSRTAGVAEGTASLSATASNFKGDITISFYFSASK